MTTVVFVFSGVIGAGCGGGDARNTEVVLKATSNSARFTADQTIPGTAVAAGIAQLDRALDQGFELHAALSRIYNSGDPFGQSLVIAFCTGASQVAAAAADTPPPTESDWRRFLVEQIRTIYPGGDFAVQVGRVNAFMTAVNLSAISPGLASRYYQACGPR